MRQKVNKKAVKCSKLTRVSGITNSIIICRPRWCFDKLTWVMWQDHRDLRGKRETYLWGIVWERLRMEHEAGRPLRWLIGAPREQWQFAEGWMSWSELCCLASQAVPGLKGKLKPYTSEWIAMYDLDDPIYLDSGLLLRTEDKLKKIRRRPWEIVLFQPELERQPLQPTEAELQAEAEDKERRDREQAEQRRIQAIERLTQQLSDKNGTITSMPQVIQDLNHLEYATYGRVVNLLWRKVVPRELWNASDFNTVNDYLSAFEDKKLDLREPPPDVVQKAISTGKVVPFSISRQKGCPEESLKKS